MSRLLLDHDIDAILVGAGDPPRPDERSAIRELAALVSAVAVRRPDVPIVLSGAMSEALDEFGDVSSRPGPIVLAPAALDRGPARAGQSIRIRIPATDEPGRRRGQARSPRRAAARGGHAGRRSAARHRPGDPGPGRRAASPGRDDHPGSRRRGPCRGRALDRGHEPSRCAWRSSPPPPSPRTSPTTPSSTASSCGPPCRPTGTASATACVSCGSRHGPTQPATAPRCGWRRPGPPSCGSPRPRPTSTRHRPTSSCAAAACGRRSRRRPWPSPTSTSCGDPEPASTRSIMPG